MKKIISLFMVLTMVLSLAACSTNQSPSESTPEESSSQTNESTPTPSNTNGKNLVVYFSMPDNVDDSTVVIDGETLGNTQYMAYVIQETVGADIFRIEPETPYPTDHDELVDLASEEQRSNARPAISGSIENIEQYDVIYVGFPNWWGDMPMILYSFFDEYDFSGKTIIPFNTHGGSGFSDTISTIKELEPNAEVLDGKARLAQLHAIFHMDEQLPFRFEWDWLPSSGLSTKDFIAPSSFEFRTGKQFRMGKKYGAVSFVQILAPELNDRMLADFLDMESNLIVSLHIQSVDQIKAIKTVKRKITDLDKSKIEEQKKAVRAGYDIDIIPSDLATYGVEAKKLLQDLQSRNERMFLVTFLVLNTADNPRQLDNNVFQASSIAQKYNCRLTRLDFQQEEGLMSCLPLGLNQIEIQRGLTTSSTAIFVPFTTQELFQNGKEALYYGINALSNNLIMVDRKLLKNPNGLILGTPGSGKSFSAKREIANCFLLTSDEVEILDPEAEYAPLVERLHGQVIKISPTSTNYINPMDLNLDYSDDESPLSLKSDFILSLCELIVGGKEGLQPVQKTIIDRCVRLVYQDYLNDPRPENMPILEDLYNLLRAQEEKEAQYIATALEIYVTGSLNVFNHRTNVDINNRIVCYDIKELGKQLKKIGMLVVQDQVWNRVTINRAAHKSTRYYIDEMHLLLKEEQTAAYTVEIWKRFRKWGGIPTGITQNVKDLLSSREVENIFENSDFVYMLNQAGGDRQILAKQLGISTHQLSYVTHSGEGEGLLFYGSTILPFVDHFPKNTELYRIMTTKPQELKKKEDE